MITIIPFTSCIQIYHFVQYSLLRKSGFVGDNVTRMSRFCKRECSDFLSLFSQYNNWGTRFLLILIYSIYLEFKIEFSITKKKTQLKKSIKKFNVLLYISWEESLSVKIHWKFAGLF